MDEKYSAGDLSSIANHILDLSRRISRCSPPMKPFIRFSEQAKVLYENRRGQRNLSLFWDFDDTLQKMLLGALKTIATPDEITRLCIEQWKENLGPLNQGAQKRLAAFARRGEKPPVEYSPRDQFIFSRTNPGDRLLYIGCGAGSECLRFAQYGYRVIGIDTDPALVSTAKEWSRYLGYPFEPICMDGLYPGFVPGLFDCLLLEFYGMQPSMDQVFTFQESLASVLGEHGKGFIVGSRKMYPSFWHRMGSPYSKAMTRWLAAQSKLDFYFSARDGCEERLLYGLYGKSHTVETLSSELSYAFDILECTYEEYDPRYILCVVQRKPRLNHSAFTSRAQASVPESGTFFRGVDIVSLVSMLHTVDTVCNILEEHENRVRQFFDNPLPSQGNNPLLAVQTELPGLIRLFEDLFIGSS